MIWIAARFGRKIGMDACSLADRGPPGRGGTAYTISGATAPKGPPGEVCYQPFGAGARWARFTSGATPTSYRRMPPGRGQREEAGLGLHYQRLIDEADADELAN